MPASRHYHRTVAINNHHTHYCHQHISRTTSRFPLLLLVPSSYHRWTAPPGQPHTFPVIKGHLLPGTLDTFLITIA